MFMQREGCTQIQMDNGVVVSLNLREGVPYPRDEVFRNEAPGVMVNDSRGVIITREVCGDSDQYGITRIYSDELANILNKAKNWKPNQR